MNLPDVSIVQISLLFVAIILLILSYIILPRLIDFSNKYSNGIHKRLVSSRIYIKIAIIASILLCIRLLLTPPEPIDQYRRVVSENVIKLNQTGQVNLLLVYLDVELAWQVNRITLPLLLLSNLFLFLQGRFKQSSNNIYGILSNIVSKLDQLNYPAKKIYAFVWLSFVFIYLAIVAVSWITQYEFNVIESAIYLIGTVMIGLFIIIAVKLIEFLAKAIKKLNIKFPLQFLGILAVVIGIPGVFALNYLVIAIVVNTFYDFIVLTGLFI